MLYKNQLNIHVKFANPTLYLLELSKSCFFTLQTLQLYKLTL